MLWHFVIIISLTLIVCGIAVYTEFHRNKAHNQTDTTLRSIHTDSVHFDPIHADSVHVDSKNSDSEKYETTVELTISSEDVKQINTNDANESEIVMEQDITFIHTNESIRSSDRKSI